MADAKDAGVVSLIASIEESVQGIHTQALDLSFNELLDMHANQELNINPAYQRLFRWSEGTQSRFIESLLLEMPVPPIYMVEEADGKYVLIDGLQRISSYLHLRGALVASHLDPPVQAGDRLVLQDCDIVEGLNGKTYDDLGTALQIRLKRAFVRVEVVRKGSNPRFKYHMFKRLNTGGQLLTEQQIRNCTIRLLNERFNEFIIALSEDAQFRRCIGSLSDERLLGAFDQELVLRFFALKNYRDHFAHEVADFLTEYMEGVSDVGSERQIGFAYDEEREVFLKTFRVLAAALGDESFAYANQKSGRQKELVKGFGVYHYEAITMGLQPYLRRLDTDEPGTIRQLREVLTEIKLDPAFIGLTTGGGRNSAGPLRDRIKFVEQRLADVTWT